MILATSIYPPDIGGPATYAKSLVEDLGFEYVIFDRKLGKLQRYLKYIFNLYKTSKEDQGTFDEVKEECGIIYAQDPICSGIPTMLVSWFRKKPYDVRIGGDYAWEKYQLNGGRKTFEEYQKFQWSLLWLLERIVIRNARQIIVPCQYLKAVVKKWGGKDIEIIENEVGSFPEVEGREELREKYNFQYKKIFLWIGRKVPWKNVEFLNKIFDTLPENYCLIHVSNLDRENIARLYKASDCLLLPSSYEGDSHVLKEATSFGLPCLVSDIPGNKEQKKDGIIFLPLLNEQKWIDEIMKI